MQTIYSRLQNLCQELHAVTQQEPPNLGREVELDNAIWAEVATGIGYPGMPTDQMSIESDTNEDGSVELRIKIVIR